MYRLLEIEQSNNEEQVPTP